MSIWSKGLRSSRRVVQEASSGIKSALKSGHWAMTRLVSDALVRSHGRQTLGIAAIMKNEGPYVLEWIAWHRCLGVSKFFIADHLSTDGTSELLSALHDKGIVTRVEWKAPPSKGMQFVAYKHLFDHFGKSVDWLAFIDVDEFFRPCADSLPLENSLQTWLSQLPARVGAVAINWTNYGSSYRIEPGEGLVCERFFLRGADSIPENRIVKSVIRTRCWKKAIGSVHVFAIQRGSFYVDSSRSLVSRGELAERSSTKVVHGAFRLNHYVIKSRIEYFAKKAARGSVNAQEKRHSEEFFLRFDKNDIADPVNSEMLALVKAEMQRLRAMLADVPGDLGHLDRQLAMLPGASVATDGQMSYDRRAGENAGLQVN